ncbi:MAG: hypothetical protein ACREIQ_03060, partial [Nitrospiria bacterium]
DEEGDALIECDVDVEITDKSAFRGITGAFARVDRGSIGRFRFNLKKGLVNPEIQETEGTMVREVSIKFPAEAEAWRGEKGLTYGYSYWAFNSSARNATDYLWMYPGRPSGHPHELTDWICKEHVRSLRVQVTFHQECECDSPQLVVLRDTEQGKEIREPWVEDLDNWNLEYWAAQRTVVLSVRRPVLGHKYRILWKLPKRDIEFSDGKARREAHKITRMLRKGRAGGDLAITEQLQRIMVGTEKRIREAFNIKPNEIIDVSLMTYLEDEGRGAEVGVIATNLPNLPDVQNFRISLGDGTAGRAWKLNQIQRYLRWEDRADDVKGTAYVPLSDSYHHVILYSIPLRHPSEPRLVFAVLNVGSADEGSRLVPYGPYIELDYVTGIGNIAVDLLYPEIFGMCDLDL